MDPLGDIIALLRPHAVLSKPITGRGEWGVRYAAHGLPGFSIVLAGHGWLTLDGEEPVLLERGDFVLLPSPPAFTLSSHLAAKCIPGQPSQTATRHGDLEGEPEFEMLGGSFRLESVNAPLLVALLPKMVHARASAGDTGRLSRIIDLIMDECADDRPGRELALEQLLGVMLVECLRWSSVNADALPRGVLSGLRDSVVAKVLHAIHADVRRGWTVAELANIAGMSRSAFAAYFVKVLGCAPMEYVTRWRMTLAQDALSQGEKSLDNIALEIGYESASAFSTAFRRRFDCSPGAFARARRSAK